MFLSSLCFFFRTRQLFLFKCFIMYGVKFFSFFFLLLSRWNDSLKAKKWKIVAKEKRHYKIITYINKIKKANVAGFVVVVKLISCAESKLVRKEKSPFHPIIDVRSLILSYNHFDLCAAFYDLKWGCTHTLQALINFQPSMFMCYFQQFIFC